MISLIRFVFAILFSFYFVINVEANEENRKFNTINAANDLANNSVQVIVCTKTGRMIISTLGNLNFYDGVGFTHIDHKMEYRLQLPQYQGDYKLSFDRFHHIWLKNDHATTCVDLLLEVFVKDPSRVVKEMGCDEELQDLFVDNDGNVWFLTNSGLIDADQHRVFQPLRDHNIQDVDVFENLLLVFYSNGEAIALNIDNGKIVQHTKAYDWDDEQRYSRMSKILRHNDSYFVIRSGEKESILLSYDVKNSSWETLLRLPYKMNDMVLKGDSLYVATNHSYFIYNISKKNSELINHVKLMSGLTLDAHCNSIAFDKQGGLWLGTDKRGVLYARPRVSPFNCYTLDNSKAQAYVTLMENLQQNITEFNGQQANCIYVDSRNWTWVGTTTGLYMYKSPQSDPVVYNRKNGLLNNVVHAIVEDRHHNMWVSTSYGISFILFSNGSPIFVNNFNYIDNVPNEAFLNCKALCMTDGTIVMQSIDHIIEFHPDSFQVVNSLQPFRLYPKLIKLLVNGYFITPGNTYNGRMIIDRAITRAQHINVNADQNSLSLTFSSLNYFRPQQTYYRVRVVGIDKEWKVYSYFNGTDLVDADGMLHLPLMGIKPGDYDIEIQASMFPDIWDGIEPYVWKLHVYQPWWQATGAYMIFLVFILALLGVNIWMFGRNTRMRARRATEESDMIRKILSFVERCDSYNSEVLAPLNEELFGGKLNENSKLTPEFVELMMKLIPYIHEQNSELTLSRLGEVGGVTVVELYDLMTSNMYKSPRDLACEFRLNRAAEMLRSSECSIEKIASESGFRTPNYFMGCFFHKYKLTPREYREEYKS